MEIILKILTLIMFIGILYNSRQRKKYDAWLTEGYQVRRGQRDGWLRLTIPMAQDGVVMRNILKQFMN